MEVIGTLGAGAWLGSVTGTAVVVAVVRSRATGHGRVVKMPCTVGGAESLRQQADVILGAAIRLIEDLHARTADVRTLDATDVAERVDRPLSVLHTFCAARPRRRPYVSALRQAGARPPSSSTHGRGRAARVRRPAVLAASRLALHRMGGPR